MNVDACDAKKASPGGWTAGYYDTDDDCDVDVVDFAELANEWLSSTAMSVQETEPGTTSTAPLSVYNARIEAESVDPNAVSDPPVNDETGIRILTEQTTASGEAILGYSAAGSYADYEINIPAIGTYDLYVNTASLYDNDAVLNFGNGITEDEYGSIASLPVDAWDAYYVTYKAGALTFPAAGTITVRITWTDATNLDWFSIVPATP